MLTDSVIESIRKNIRKFYPDVKVDSNELYAMIMNEIFKRDISEGDAATEAKKAIQKIEKKLATAKIKKEATTKNE